MTTVKEALESLSIEQRKAIMNSFNELLPHTIEFRQGFFLCVHQSDEIQGTEIIQSAGFWTLRKRT